MFAFFVDNRLLTPNMDINVIKNVPPKRPTCYKIRVFFWGGAPILVSFWAQSWPQNDPKIRPNGALKGAPGGAMGPQNCPYVDLGAILVSKMTSK